MSVRQETVLQYFDDIRDHLSDPVAQRLLDVIQDHLLDMTSRLDSLQGTMKVIRELSKAANAGQYARQSYRLKPLSQQLEELSPRRPHDDVTATSVPVDPEERQSLDRLFG